MRQYYKSRYSTLDINIIFLQFENIKDPQQFSVLSALHTVVGRSLASPNCVPKWNLLQRNLRLWGQIPFFELTFTRETLDFHGTYQQ